MSKKKISIIVGIVIVIGVVISVAILKPNGSTAFASNRGIKVTTETVKRQNISSTISASGVVEEVNKTDVYFDTVLKVKKLLVKENDKVTIGQKLIEFDMDNLNSEYEQAKLNRNIQALNLEKIRGTDSTQNIKALELSIQQSQESLKIDQRNLDLAAKDYGNSKLLYNNGSISKSDYDKYEKAYKDAEDRVQMTTISYESAKSNLENAQKNDTTVKKNNTLDVSSQETQLKLRDIAIADMEKKLAQIAENSVSTMDGVVTVLNATEGGFINTASPVFTLSDNTKLQIKADVKEFDSKNVKLGQKVTVTGDGIDETVDVEGTVTEISSTAQKVKTASGEETIVNITVAIDKGYESLKPGLTVTCKVITNSRQDAAVAKYSMLKDGSDGQKKVFVYTKESIAREVKVKTGIASDLNVEITDGLKGGEEVILNPPNTLQDGVKVKKDSN